MTTLFDEKYLEFKRKGDKEKFGWMEKINQVIQPSQKKRIQANDKSVLLELVLPKWVSWELLYSWATKEEKNIEGKICIFCNQRHELGIDFQNKFICQNCFIALKEI